MSKVVVTGGASFIGSHLVERLLKKGDEVWVLDDLSSGSIENLANIWTDISFSQLDLKDPTQARKSIPAGTDIIYHLAADHGGRGYVAARQVACSSNFALDRNVFEAAIDRGVPKVIFASSGCIYPMFLQGDPNEVLYLNEKDAGPPYDPDGLYGWAKMAAELTLTEMFKEVGIKSVSCRFFTVYGPRGKENHAVMAFIARTFIKQDPFVLWGDGSALRNWTYVDDIAEGMLRSSDLAETEGNFAINLGTMDRISVLEGVSTVIRTAQDYAYSNTYTPELIFEKNKPVGPLNRIADNEKMVRLLDLEPVLFVEGVERTLEWYFSTKDRNYIKENLERLLIERR